MNPNDYDDDGNNIVPCPICLSQYCPSKDGGKCPDEEDFIKSTTNMNKKQWEEEFDKEDFKWFDTYQNEFVSINDHPLSDKIKNFISALLKEREAEIRKEINMDIMPKNYKGWDKYFYGWEESRKEMENKKLNEIRKETIEAVLDITKNRIQHQAIQAIKNLAKEKFNITI